MLFIEITGTLSSVKQKKIVGGGKKNILDITFVFNTIYLTSGCTLWYVYNTHLFIIQSY